jgi:hypothetical protein
MHITCFLFLYERIYEKEWTILLNYKTLEGEKLIKTSIGLEIK